VGRRGRVSAPTHGVLREAWGLYKAHWQHLLGVALVVFAGMALIRAVAAFLFEPSLAWLVAFVVTLLGYFLVQGALVKAVADVRDGRADLSIPDTLRAAWERIGPLATTSSLAAVGIFIGLVFFVLPGLVLMTWWVVIIPAVVLENAGTRQAFRRSRELVRGWGWHVFGVIVLTILVLIGVSIGLDLLLYPLADWLQGFVSQILVGTLTAPLAALAWTVLYYRLREARSTASDAEASTALP
jgi:hypothetical protein